MEKCLDFKQKIDISTVGISMKYYYVFIPKIVLLKLSLPLNDIDVIIYSTQ